jgi:hypothetical protein
MKKPGTPEIDDSRPNGSAGVNVLGDGARGPEPAPAAADEPPGVAAAPPGVAAGVAP